MAGYANFHRAGHVIDTLHDLERFVLHVLGVFFVVGLGLDEEGRSTGIAIRRLYHEVAAEAGLVRRGHEFRVGVGLVDQYVRRTVDAGFAGQPGQFDLRVETLAQFDRRQRDHNAQLVADFLGLFIQHHEQHARRPVAGLLDSVDDFLVLQHVIADVFHGFELGMTLFARHEHARMIAVEGIEVVDMEEPVDELFQPEQVECGRGDEEYRCFVATEVSQDVGETPNLSGSWHVVLAVRLCVIFITATRGQCYREVAAPSPVAQFAAGERRSRAGVVIVAALLRGGGAECRSIAAGQVRLGAEADRVRDSRHRQAGIQDQRTGTIEPAPREHLGRGAVEIAAKQAQQFAPPDADSTRPGRRP